jgi:hypothetical protein
LQIRLFLGVKQLLIGPIVVHRGYYRSRPGGCRTISPRPADPRATTFGRGLGRPGQRPTLPSRLDPRARMSRGDARPPIRSGAGSAKSAPDPLGRASVSARRAEPFAPRNSVAHTDRRATAPWGVAEWVETQEPASPTGPVLLERADPARVRRPAARPAHKPVHLQV